MKFLSNRWLGYALLLVGTPSAAEQPLAFPGAVGQGAASVGGRGGDVYHVTSLADYSTRSDEPKIEGSLRHAIRSATGPRTVVFDVAGVIRLKQPLEVKKNNLTIAGQTSPGGVTLFGYPFEVSRAKDVVIRHLRVRCGDLNARNRTDKNPAGAGDLDASSANAIQIGGGSERVILDHVSTSWGMDETLSITNARDVTVQHSIVAEALDRSYHAKGAHGYGSLVRGMVTPQDQQANRGGYTLYGDLWAHNRARNPSMGGQQFLRPGLAEADRLQTDVNIVNCVVYDWSEQATHRNNLGGARVNLVGNYYVAGPMKASKYFFRGGGGPQSPTQIYQRGNCYDRDQDAGHNGVLYETDEQIAVGFDGLDDDDVVRSEGEPLGFLASVPDSTILKAPAAYAVVAASVGASLWRDAIDQRVIDSLETRSGKVIDSQEVYRGGDGVLPGVNDLPEVHRPAGFDCDGDGMADAFERSHGLDPNDPEDRNGLTLRENDGAVGLTNLEVYLDMITHQRDAY
ncbi:hypothetical protein Pla108_18020 [Botrimarina colliarenosi]|uniref:Pectate lyase n=1 Tax=Botrimarina colliarenosi TaxID=2528001 RepID=A0A5C6AE08_9BACT|nr:hypothetical protein [Botrimarina colliarenosi]TWT97650.1 hypothetical protein Pla108_18020 [Botrimarina colliarenosi]